MEVAVSKLNEIITELAKIASDGHANKELFQRMAERAKGIANTKFGANSLHKENIEKVENSVINSFIGFTMSHAKRLSGLVQVMIDEIELTQHKQQQVESTGTSNKNNDQAPLAKHTMGVDNSKVFVVHGHNDGMKQATARTIEKFGLKPIILHEQANSGDTIIEKFTRHSNVGFAVVLLSADDYGYAKSDKATKANLRARQNVIFELGFFYGAIGRKKVVAIFEQAPGFEKPSDIDGVIYIPYNSNDSKWQFDLARELSEVGYKIDANVLIRG